MPECPRHVPPPPLTREMPTMTWAVVRSLACLLAVGIALPAFAETPDPPEGFTAIFNRKDLTGWKGLVKDPKARANMTPQQLNTAQEAADKRMRDHWKVEDGVLVFDGKGDSLCTAEDYADF